MFKIFLTALSGTCSPRLLSAGVSRRMRCPGWLFLSLVLVLGGCTTPRALPVVDLAASGWTTRTGQAVWYRPPELELAGDILVAYRGDRSLVQFTKGHVEVVTARREGSIWDAQFFGRKHFQGSGKPPERTPWLHVAEALRKGSAGKPWVWSASPSGQWKIQNPKTGEKIEGFFAQ